MSWEKSKYFALISKICNTGEEVKTRNAIVKKIFGHNFTLNLINDGFPILQSRYINYKAVAGELSAFLSNRPITKTMLNKLGCNYWDKWADSNGDINIDYGKLWHDFNNVNQLKNIIENIKKTPFSRRHIITNWNPASKSVAPCCHVMYQFNVQNNKLDLLWYQRSVDVLVGLPHDIVFAALLLLIICNEVSLKPNNIIFYLGDTHIYKEHMLKVIDYMRNANNLSYTHKFKYTLYNSSIYKFHPDFFKIHDYEKLVYSKLVFPVIK